MTDANSLVISLPLAITLVGAFIGVMTFLGNRKRQTKEDIEKERKEEARWTKIEAKLEIIESNTSELKTKIDSHDHLLTKHEKDIGVLKEQMKTKGGK